MNNFQLKLVLQTIFLLALLCGCSKDLPRLSSIQMEAINHNQKGIKAEARGNHDLALEEFKEALRVHSAIDNNDGKVVALVNIARLNRLLGEYAVALAAVDQALTLVPPQSPLLSEVAFEKSKVELQRTNLAIAHIWAEKSIAAESSEKRCSRINLLATILYQEKDFYRAKEKAEEALKICKENELLEEEANAQRLLGLIFTVMNRPKEALHAYTAALAQDKVAGKSRKIAADLSGTANLHRSQGQKEKAVDFFQRAYIVSASNGDTVAAADTLLKMADICDEMGKKDKAALLRQERETLLKQGKVP